MKLVAILDRAYPKDKQMEAVAISQSVVSGDCFKCPYYKRCSSDRTFHPPADTACMKWKRKLLKGGDVSKLDTSSEVVRCERRTCLDVRAAAGGAAGEGVPEHPAPAVRW